MQFAKWRRASPPAAKPARSTVLKRLATFAVPRSRYGLAIEPLEDRLNLAPVLVSLEANLVPGSATNANSLEYLATFSEPVTGVDPTDFALALSGSLGTTLTQIQAVDSSAFKLTISGITGNGTLGLNLVADGSIRDALLNPLSSNFTGQAYSIDHDAPFVQSINRATPTGAITNATSLDYTVTFNEAVTGVDPTDFSLSLVGTVGATLTQVQAVNSSVYTVTVSGITGGGKLGLNLSDNGTIRDLANNRLRQASATTLFQSQLVAGTGQDPMSLAIGDLNGDGYTDLVTPNETGDTVSVLLGNGNGTFQSNQDFATGDYPLAVAVADVNGDGNLDVVAANSEAHTVSVLLGNGNGTLQPKQDIATNPYPHSLALADVNGDGTPDLVIANYGDRSASVLLGNGDGTFQPKQDFVTGAGAVSVVVADLNGDGKPDLMTANRGASTTSVLLGNGNGTFQPKQDFATGSLPNSLAVADVNGDGKPDAVTANRLNNNASVLLGNGNGTFQPKADIVTGPTGSYTPSVAIADVNGDGKPDLVTLNRVTATASVLVGNGNGTFQPKKDFATAYSPSSVLVSDINGDGRPDLVLANTGGNTAGVLLGNRNGNFTGQFYTIDRIAPFVQSIDRTMFATKTNQSSVTFQVTFSEAVTGVDVTDFVVIATGTVGTTLTQVQQLNTSVYRVTVSGITGDGTLGVNLVANGSIQDAILNPLTDNFTGQAYTIDQTAPFALSIDRTPPDGTFDGSTVKYTVTFSEPVTGVDLADFVLVFTGTVGGNLTQLQSVSSSVYTVTVSGISGNGTLGLNLIANGSILDDVSNPLTSNFTGQIYTPVYISVFSMTAAEGNAGTTPFEFTVTLSAPSNATVTVQYATVDGTATTAGNDYVATSGTLTFAPGQTAQVVTVLVNGDTVAEVNEVFTVNLSGATNGTITGGAGTGTIVTDDGVPPTAVVNRRVFYNQSKFDGNSSGVNASDDLAIATDKVALVPGAGQATFANITSYTRGINGIMVDIAGTHGMLSASDFIFKVGANNTPSLWAPTLGVPSITVRPGAGSGGSDRVEIIFTTGNAPKNQWLEVVVKGNDTRGGFNTNTQLAASDIFFFGNRVGDAGSGTASQAITSFVDENAARTHGGGATVTSIWDYDRTGLVSATDGLTSRFNAGTLLKINIANPPAAPEAAPAVAISDKSAESAIITALAANSLLKVDTLPAWVNAQLQKVELAGHDLNASLIDKFIANLAHDVVPRPRAIQNVADKLADQLAVTLDWDDSLLDDLLTER